MPGRLDQNDTDNDAKYYVTDKDYLHRLVVVVGEALRFRKLEEKRNTSISDLIGEWKLIKKVYGWD